MHTSSYRRALAVLVTALCLAAGALVWPGAASAAAAFSRTPQPVVAGTAQVGETVYARTGRWSPRPAAFSFRWYVGSRRVDDVSSRAWTLPPGAAGKRVRVEVTATRRGFARTSRLSAAVRVRPGALTPAVPLAVLDDPDGTAPDAGQPAAVEVGTRLRAVAGSWAPGPVAFTYQWRIDGQPVAGADDVAWRVPADAEGRTVSVSVTGRRAGYAARSSVSAGVDVVAGAAPRPSEPPMVLGQARVGETLTAEPGTWSDDLSLGYQWLRDGTPVPGATARTLDLVAEDLGASMSVRVTATRPGYADGEATSSGTAAVEQGEMRPGLTVVVGGDDPRVGLQLRVDPGAWRPEGASFVFEWSRDGEVLSRSWEPTYTPTRTDLGRHLTVRVSATAPGYAPAEALPVATAVVELPPGWAGTTVEPPADASTPARPSLAEVSCGAPGSCVGVGSYAATNGFSAPWIREQVDGTWRSLRAPLPPDGDPDVHASLLAVSCAADGACTAVGHYADLTGRGQAMLASRSAPGASWSAVRAPVPEPPGTESVSVWSVDCAPGGVCAALGSFDGNREQMLVSGSPQGWSVQRIPAPAGARPGSANVVDLACASAGECVAVGTSVADGGWSQPLLLTTSTADATADASDGGATWTARTVGMGVGAGVATWLRAVACGGATLSTCVAVGGTSEGGQTGVVVQSGEGGWLARAAAQPRSTTLDDPWRVKALTDVACSSATSCTAIGLDRGTGYEVTLMAGQWTPSLLPDLVDEAFFGLDCEAPGACVVVGGARARSDLPRQALALRRTVSTEGGGVGRWEVQRADPSVESRSGASSLRSLACPAVDACLAVGSYSAEGQAEQTMAWSWRR